MKKTISKLLFCTFSFTTPILGANASVLDGSINYNAVYLSQFYNALSAVSTVNIASPLLAARAGVTMLGNLNAGRPEATVSIPTPTGRPVQIAAKVEEAQTTASIRRPAVAPAASRTASNAVFDTVAFPFKRLGALKKLAPSLSEIQNGTAMDCDASACSAAALAIKAAYGRTTQSSIRDKLNAVNISVNRSIRYARDIDTYKVADLWASPSETMKKQAGDCEDFAILKMAALHADGVPMQDMAIVVLFDQKRRFYHAVLSVAVGDRYFVLDNMRDQVLADTQLTDYVPLYSIVDGRGYFHGSRVASSKLVAGNTMPLEKIAPGEGQVF